MKKNYIFTVAAIAAMVFTTNSAKAQVEVSAGADAVSSYIWRGLNLGGASVQPGVSVSFKGFTLGAWGSVNIAPSAYNNGKTDEFDLYLNYSIGGFSATVTDYTFPKFLNNSLDEFDYFNYKDVHTLELGLAYTISEKVPLSLAVSSNLFGADDWDGDGKSDFSTYAELGYSLAVKSDITFDFALGFTPAKGAYSQNGFAFTNISIKASKEIKITDDFSLPAFAQVVLNPDAKIPYLVFGVSF
ncbi:MAG: hypothetical protein LBN23_05595 [Paludibacter sp.]|jgi:hypothetical protein|nr:hypothetical protein [Paludibacter sp.]